MIGAVKVDLLFKLLQCKLDLSVRVDLAESVESLARLLTARPEVRCAGAEVGIYLRGSDLEYRWYTFTKGANTFRVLVMDIF